jgi:hypothetical protein
LFPERSEEMTVTGATAVAWWSCLSWDERSSKVSQLTNIENLSTDECWRLLACQQIGRLAVADDEGVHIFPVNYLVDGGAIAIRSEANALIRCAPLHRVEFGSTTSTATTAPAGRSWPTAPPSS